MGTPWQFATDAKSDAFCREIAAEMVRKYGVSDEEAVGRINRGWRGQDILGEMNIVYHELPEYWAHVMYLGKDSYWWITGEKREQLGLGPVVPKPYP
jgi:hypothetical protein